MQLFTPPLNATADIIGVFVQHIKDRVESISYIYNSCDEWLGEWEVQLSQCLSMC